MVMPYLLKTTKVMDEMTLNGVAQQMFVQGTRAKMSHHTLKPKDNTWRDIQAEKQRLTGRKVKLPFLILLIMLR